MTPEDCCLRGANRQPGEEQEAAGNPNGLLARMRRRLRAARSSSSSSQKPRLSTSNRVEVEPSEPLLLLAANRFLIDTCSSKSRRASKARSSSRTQAPSSSTLLFSLIVVLTTTTQLANCSMCQHHQAMLDLAAATATLQSAPDGPARAAQGANKAPFETQNLVVCPKSSQYNSLPQFPARHVSPSLERQQREILKHLNASFANHLQLGASQPSSVGVLSSSGDYPESLPSELIDDELLNEIISPLVVDAAYERAKELIVKRRKLENELVRQGECHSPTYLSLSPL